MSGMAFNFSQNVLIFGKEKSRLFWSLLTLAVMMGAALTSVLIVVGLITLTDLLGLRHSRMELPMMGMGGLVLILSLAFSLYMLKKLGFFRMNFFIIFSIAE